MIRYAMARGPLVVDENVSVLAELLKDRNFKVLEPFPGMQDSTIVDRLCTGRIIVTTNVADFVDLAPIYEFGIIGVSSLALTDPERVATVISQQYSKRSLNSVGPFLLKVTPSGTTFKKLD